MREIYNEQGDEIEHKMGVFPQDAQKDAQPLQIVSDRYTLINHIDILNELRSALNTKDFPIVELNFHVSDNYGKMFLDICLDKQEKIRGVTKVNDMVRYDLRIFNGVDLSMSFGDIPKTLRVVCLNLATHSDIGQRTIYKHVGLTLEQIGDSLQHTLDYHSEIAQLYNGWANTEIPQLRFTSEKLKNNQEVLHLNAVEMGFDEATQTWIARNMPKKYLAEVHKDNPKTQWELFNSLTAVNTHDKTRSIFTKQSFDRRIMKFVELFNQ